MIHNKLIIAGIVTAVLLAIVGGFWLHYQSLVDENQRLAEDRATAVATINTLNTTLKRAENVITMWQESQEVFNETLDALAAAQVEATIEQRRLNSVLAKHDLERLTHAKPVLIERRINSGTDRALGVLERDTALNQYTPVKRTGAGDQSPPTTPAADPKAATVGGADTH